MAETPRARPYRSSVRRGLNRTQLFSAQAIHATPSGAHGEPVPGRVCSRCASLLIATDGRFANLAPESLLSSSLAWTRLTNAFGRVVSIRDVTVWPVACHDRTPLVRANASRARSVAPKRFTAEPGRVPPARGPNTLCLRYDDDVLDSLLAFFPAGDLRPGAARPQRGVTRRACRARWPHRRWLRRGRSPGRGAVPLHEQRWRARQPIVAGQCGSVG